MVKGSFYEKREGGLSSVPAVAAAGVSRTHVVSVRGVDSLAAGIGDGARVSFDRRDDLVDEVVPETVFLSESESYEGTENTGADDVLRADGGVARGKETAYRSAFRSGNFVFVFSHKRKILKYVRTPERPA